MDDVGDDLFNNQFKSNSPEKGGGKLRMDDPELVNVGLCALVDWILVELSSPLRGAHGEAN